MDIQRVFDQIVESSKNMQRPAYIKINNLQKDTIEEYIGEYEIESTALVCDEETVKIFTKEGDLRCL